jgi:hypothetical protein
VKTGRPTKFTPKLQAQIAELLWLAFTDAQIAEFCEVDERSIRRIRAAGFCPEIKKAEIEKEKVYRKRIWDGAPGWQGAAWFLERKYLTQFSRPETQFLIQNNTLNQVNNTLVITAEVASSISKRRKEVESKVEKLFKDRRKRMPGRLEDVHGNGTAEPEAQT